MQVLYALLKTSFISFPVEALRFRVRKNPPTWGASKKKNSTFLSQKDLIFILFILRHPRERTEGMESVRQKRPEEPRPFTATISVATLGLCAEAGTCSSSSPLTEYNDSVQSVESGVLTEESIKAMVYQFYSSLSVQSS